MLISIGEEVEILAGGMGVGRRMQIYVFHHLSIVCIVCGNVVQKSPGSAHVTLDAHICVTACVKPRWRSDCVCANGIIPAGAKSPFSYEVHSRTKEFMSRNGFNVMSSPINKNALTILDILKIFATREHRIGSLKSFPLIEIVSRRHEHHRSSARRE